MIRSGQGWTARLASRVGEALRGGVRPTDVFIVGYPKSGMTWMEFLLCHALLVRSGGERITLSSINEYIPNLARLGPGDPLGLHRYADRPAPRVFFTHTPFDARMLRGRVVYMLRGPRSVMVSYYHYHCDCIAGFDRTIDAFLEQESYYPCRWDDHVRGWLGAGGGRPNVLVVRYEALRADTPGGLRRVLEHTGAAFTPEDVDRAVRLSSFDRMREVESRHPVGPQGREDRPWFVRRGRSNGWRDELSAGQVRLIERRFLREMQEAGYEPMPG